MCRARKKQPAGFGEVLLADIMPRAAAAVAHVDAVQQEDELIKILSFNGPGYWQAS